MYQWNRGARVGWPTGGSQSKTKESIALYREDGLGIFKKLSGPELDRK